MHLLLELCLLFLVNVDSSTDCTQMANVYIHKFSYFLFSFFHPAPQIFLYLPLFLPPWFYLPHNSVLSEPSGRFLQHFNRALKINHLFFYSHWLCYNAATLRGQTRGQSIISPLPIQAAVWLLSTKHRDKIRLPHSGIQSSHRFRISTSSFKGKNLHKTLSTK